VFTGHANLLNEGRNMNLSRITELSNRYYVDQQRANSRMPRLSVFCRDMPSQIEAWMYEPALCVTLQGSKTVSIGNQVANVGAGDALIISHDLPVVSRITKASTQVPYFAIVLMLDLQLLQSLCDQVHDALEPISNPKSLSLGKVEDAWLIPLLRYFELAGSGLDALVLGPTTLREIHYRLLLSKYGGMLRNLLVADSHASRVAKAIRQLRSHYRAPLRVSDLARVAGMSDSSFHEHFKAVTGTTPLQYQKDLRLIEAHSLLTALTHTVSEAAYAVGYESPNHFSRDYSKKFAVPPSKSAHKLGYGK
jgi:AraC-like DNA-binding protein